MTRHAYYFFAILALLALASCSSKKKTCSKNSDCPTDQVCSVEHLCEKGSATGDTTTTDDTNVTPGDTTSTPDTSGTPTCVSHGECKSDEYCDKGGHCRQKLGAGELCFGVYPGSEMNAACTSGACYREAFETSSYRCAASTEGCILDGKSVSKGSIACMADSSGYVKCEGNGVWGKLFACAVGGFVCDAFTPDKDKGFTGTTEAQECKNGEGCLPLDPECKGCIGYFMVDKSTGKCRTNCKDALGQDDDSLCWSIATCIGGACVPTLLRIDGLQCDVNEQCKSGKCVPTTDEDGNLSQTAKVCCSEACDSPCHYCDQEGKCRALSLGADKQGRLDARCPSTPQSECGTTGRCGVDGKCANWTETTICRKRECSSDKEIAPAFCDGKGSCPTAKETNCTNGCDAGGLTCKGSVACTTHETCAGDEFCGKDGFCHKQREKFESCDDLVYSGLDASRACASGQCSTDSLASGTKSICTEVDKCVTGGALFDKDAVACKGNDGTYVCKGKDGWTLQEDCPGGPCDLDGGQGKGFITQQCNPLTGCNHECKPCDGSLNATESGCPISCKADEDCWSSHYCSPDGTCEPRAGTGEVCEDESGSKKCLDGLFCVESDDEAVKKCCPEDCSGICNYCGVTVTNVDGKLVETWSCKPRGSGYVDPTCTVPTEIKPHPDCATYACTGDPKVESCQFPVGKSCGDGVTCTGGVLYTYSCGKDGSCVAEQEKCQSGDCAADGKSCKPLCATHDDCRTLQPELCGVVGTQDNNCYCDVSGLCRARLADGKKCEGVSKPKSGLPDDGVCTKDSLCKEDTLSYVTTNINNGKGHWYCAKSTECVDEDENGSVTRYDSGYTLCAKEAHTDGTLYFTCNSGTWVQAGSKCATNKYPGCSYGNLGPNSGYQESICQSGPGTSATSGCNLSTCKTCGGFFKNPDETKKCYTSCQCCGIGCLIIVPLGTTTTSTTTTGMTSAELSQYASLPQDVIIVPLPCYDRDTNCVSSYYCSSNSCVPDLNGNAACTRDGMCKSGSCGDDGTCDCTSSSHCSLLWKCNLTTHKCYFPYVITGTPTLP